MVDSSSPAFRVAGCTVRPVLNRVETATGRHTLEPKVMDVLVCLAAHPGEVMSKEHLLARVWPDVVVGEDVLIRAVSELRRVFGDAAGSPRVIETIRKRGYRLVGPVTRLSDAVSPPRPSERRRAMVALALVALVAGGATIASLSSSGHPSAPAAAPHFVPLATSSGNEVDPAVSPDGTRVAFAWNEGSGDELDLFVQLVGREDRLRLSRGPASDRAPAWSPDGTRLAFSRFDQEGGCRIAFVSTLGGAVQSLGPCPDPSHFRMDWSPDGGELAVSARTSAGPLALQLLDVETLERRPLTAPPSNVHGDELPAFSPDGHEVAFVRFVGPDSGDVYRVSRKGGEPERLTTDSLSITGLDWVEAGRAIVFSSSRAGLYSLWQVPADGGGPTLVVGGGARMKHPSTSRDGTVIAYESWRYGIGIQESSLEPAEGEPPSRRLIGESEDWNYQPRFSPDGRHIAYGSTRSGTYEIWRAERDGSGKRRLTSFGGAYVGWPRWSPDGRQIVFVARTGGHADLYLVEATGGPVRRLTAHPLDELAPAWSGDGRSILFATRRTGDWEIFRHDLQSHDERRITAGGGFAAAESPDGQALVFTRPDTAGIWRRPLGGGEATRLVLAYPPGRRADWIAAAPGVYYRDAAGSLKLRPWSSGAERTVVSLSDLAWPGFDVSPDGTTLLYTRAGRRECDVMVLTRRPRRAGMPLLPLQPPGRVIGGRL